MDTPTWGDVMEIGKYIDFHYKDSTADYDGRLFFEDKKLHLELPNVGDVALVTTSDLSSRAYATYYNGSDANTFASGLYLVERCKNTPDESTWWLIISFVYPAAKAGAQIAYGLINKDFKRRSYISGTWDSWGDVIG